MQALNLNSTAPASRFPEAADVYVCDKCGRDITEHLHRGRPHVWRPLGPARYIWRLRCEVRHWRCGMGQPGATGENKSSEAEFRPAGSSRLMLSAIGALVYFTFARGGVLLTVLAILSASPAVVCLALFVGTALDLIEIVASVFRKSRRNLAQPSGRSSPD